MEKGDKIIWDSGWGYEIGYFIEETIGDTCFMHNPYKVNLITGVVIGETLKPRREVIPYTEEISNRMLKTYGYEYIFKN